MRKAEAKQFEDAVLETLRRLPPEIVLDVAGREFAMKSSHACLLGWAMRATLGRDFDLDAESVYINPWEQSPVMMLANRYGGSANEWGPIFYGVIDNRKPHIERAWVRRMNEIVDEGEQPDNAEAINALIAEINAVAVAKELAKRAARKAKVEVAGPTA